MAYSIKNSGLAALCMLLTFCGCKKDRISVVATEISSPTSNQLMSVRFQGNMGFACGGSQFSESEIIRSQDGGETWSKLTLPSNIDDKQLYGMDVLPNGTLDAVGFGGVTFHSDDFGNTINFQQEPRYKHWRSICYRTQTEAIICGQEENREGYLSTITKATNWAYAYSENIHTFGMYHITFPDSLTGYIAGFGAITKSTDGGKTWNFTPAKNDYFTATAWFTPSSGVAIGWEGSILKTTNGGDDWETIRNANKLAQKKIRLKSLAMNSQGELVAVGEDGCIIHSGDKGQNWDELENFTDMTFESIAFLNDDTFFVVGDDGRIFKVQL